MRIRWPAIICCVAICGVALVACGGSAKTAGRQIGRRTATDTAAALRPAHHAAGAGAAAAGCARRARLARGMWVAPARIGATRFLSAMSGVGVTASFVNCYRRVTGGLEVSVHRQLLWLAVTRDGGRSWRTVGTALPARRIPVAGPEQLSASSVKRVWVLDGEGDLLATAGGGRRWSRQPLPRPVVAIAQSHRSVWAASCAPRSRQHCRLALYRSPLGGAGWSRLPLAPGTATSSASLITPSDRVIVVDPVPNSYRRHLLVSTDSGLRWTVRAEPVAPRMPIGFCGDLSASGPAEWWLICSIGGGMNHSANALERTTDGGQRWRTVSAVTNPWSPAVTPDAIPGIDIVSFGVASSRRLWLGTSLGEVFASNDGGVHWRPVPGLNTEGAYPEYFDVLSASRAWLIAPGTGVWRTTDGVHWRKLNAVLACRASQLTVHRGHSSAGLGTSGAYIVFANRSRTPCTLTGWPELVGVTSAGRIIAARDVRSTMLGPNIEGVPTVTVRPGGHADAAFTGVDPRCAPGRAPHTELCGFTPPGTTARLRLSAWIPYLGAYLPTCAGIRVTMVVAPSDLYDG